VAQLRTHPLQQLLHGEGLADVIVGSERKAGHPVVCFIQGGEEDNRDSGGTRLPFQGTKHVPAAHIRQHHIQDDQAGLID
jgi:hypothetical protein